MSKTYTLSLLLLLSLLLTSCTHLIYHPTQVLYVDTTQLSTPPKSIEAFSEHLNKTIMGWHFSAQPDTAEQCMLYLHGNAQNRSSHFLSLYWIITKGIQLYVFDYPGYGQTQGKPTPDTTVESAKTTIRFVSEQKHCKEFFVYGHSLGGQIAMRALWELEKESGPKVDLLIVDSSFLSYKNIARDILKSQWLTWPLSFMASIMVSDHRAIGDDVKNIKTPMLIIHSKQDEIIDFKFGQDIYQKATSPKNFWAKTTEHNNLYEKDEGLRLRDKLIKELKKSRGSKP